MEKINLKIYQILLKQIITDKSHKMNEQYPNKYAFFVKIQAHKSDIRRAVEKIFDVGVKSVKTLYRPTRTRSRKGRERAIKYQKIAYITLKSGTIQYKN